MRAPKILLKALFPFLFLAAIGGPARAQEARLEDTTLGALTERAVAVAEIEVREVRELLLLGDPPLAVVYADVVERLGGDAEVGEMPLAIYGPASGCAAPSFAPGERAIVFLENPEGDGFEVAAAGAIGAVGFRLAGAARGKLPGGEGKEADAVRERIRGYLGVRGGTVAARRELLRKGLEHWHPRIAADSAFDLAATPGPFSRAEAASIAKAHAANASAFADPRPVIALAPRLPGAEAERLLLPIALRPAPDVLGQAAAQALGHAGRVKALAAAARDAVDPGVRRRLVLALGLAGEKALPGVRAATRDPDSRVRLAALLGLLELGPTGAKALAAVELKFTEDREVFAFLARARASPARARAELGE